MFRFVTTLSKYIKNCLNGALSSETNSDSANSDPFLNENHKHLEILKNVTEITLTSNSSKEFKVSEIELKSHFESPQLTSEEEIERIYRTLYEYQVSLSFQSRKN